jgi:hypothetical protein
MALSEARRNKHRKYMHRRYQDDPVFREKHKARVSVRKAILKGRLEQKPCEACGDEETEAHHDDYSKPLVVRWFCRLHHEAQHGGPGCHR